MNSDSTRQHRKPIHFAIGNALLVLVGWILTAWLQQSHAQKSGLLAAPTAAMESGDSSETSEQPRSCVRDAKENDEQIRRRVESMLAVKPNGIAIVTVPKAALDQCLAPPGFPLIPDALSGIATKDALKGCLEGVLKEGGTVKVKVNDQNHTEYSGKDFQMEIEVTESTQGDSNALIHMTFNGSKLINQMSIFPGFGLVYQFPPPSDEGVVILIGKDPAQPLHPPHSDQ